MFAESLLACLVRCVCALALSCPIKRSVEISFLVDHLSHGPSLALMLATLGRVVSASPPSPHAWLLERGGGDMSHKQRRRKWATSCRRCSAESGGAGEQHSGGPRLMYARGQQWPSLALTCLWPMSTGQWFLSQRLHPCSGALSFGALGLETIPADETRLSTGWNLNAPPSRQPSYLLLSFSAFMCLSLRLSAFLVTQAEATPQMATLLFRSARPLQPRLRYFHENWKHKLSLEDERYRPKQQRRFSGGTCSCYHLLFFATIPINLLFTQRNTSLSSYTKMAAFIVPCWYTLLILALYGVLLLCTQ